MHFRQKLIELKRNRSRLKREKTNELQYVNQLNNKIFKKKDIQYFIDRSESRLERAKLGVPLNQIIIQDVVKSRTRILINKIRRVNYVDKIEAKLEKIEKGLRKALFKKDFQAYVKLQVEKDQFKEIIDKCIKQRQHDLIQTCQSRLIKRRIDKFIQKYYQSDISFIPSSENQKEEHQYQFFKHLFKFQRSKLVNTYKVDAKPFQIVIKKKKKIVIKQVARRKKTYDELVEEMKMEKLKKLENNMEEILKKKKEKQVQEQIEEENKLLKFDDVPENHLIQKCKISNPLRKFKLNSRSKSLISENWISNHFRLTQEPTKQPYIKTNEKILHRQQTLKFGENQVPQDTGQYFNRNQGSVYRQKTKQMSESFKTHTFNFFKGISVKTEQKRAKTSLKSRKINFSSQVQDKNTLSQFQWNHTDNIKKEQEYLYFNKTLKQFPQMNPMRKSTVQTGQKWRFQSVDQKAIDILKQKSLRKTERSQRIYRENNDGIFHKILKIQYNQYRAEKEIKGKNINHMDELHEQKIYNQILKKYRKKLTYLGKTPLHMKVVVPDQKEEDKEDPQFYRMERLKNQQQVNMLQLEIQ